MATVLREELLLASVVPVQFTTGAGAHGPLHTSCMCSRALLSLLHGWLAADKAAAHCCRDIFQQSKAFSASACTMAAGAENITLEGVFHGPLGSADADRPWYGSPSVLEQWIRVVYDGKELDREFQVEVGQML